MLTLFLRAILLYFLVFIVLRLTGKRQVGDLQPFDLLITLLIADLAGCAIADPSIPLAYSVVPILALYLVQQLLTWACLKFALFRQFVCGSPVILVNDGKLQEQAMRDTNYTVIDLLDQLRAKDIFDLNTVSYAILETNGSMSVLPKEEARTPSADEWRHVGLRIEKQQNALAQMLIIDGALCHHAMRRLGIDESWICARLSEFGVTAVEDVFYLYRAADGTLSLQTKLSAGARCASKKTGGSERV